MRNLRTWRDAGTLNCTQKDNGGSRTHNLLSVMVPITELLNTHDGNCLIIVYLLALIKAVPVTQGFHCAAAACQVSIWKINNCPFNCNIFFYSLLTIFLSTSRVGKINQRHRRRGAKTTMCNFLMTAWKVLFFLMRFIYNHKDLCFVFLLWLILNVLTGCCVCLGL